MLLFAALLAAPGAAPRGPSALAANGQASPSAGSRYTITDLGTLGGASEAFAISNNGQVAGIYVTGAGQDQAFLWNDGVMQGLGTLGGVYSRAYGVNDDGQVVGVSATGNGRFHAFLWQNGSMQDLGTLGGGIVSIAFGINNSGQVVGHSDTSAYQLHAFLWNGGMTDLGTLSGGDASWGYGINDNGQAVGGSRIAAYPDITAHAFLWSGGMQDLGTLGWKHSIAYGINDNGQVVGRLANDDQTWNAFLWNGGMQGLGGTQSTAADINNDGLIVGESGGQAVLWENGQLKNLNSLIDANSGWVLLSARAINEKGQIVGKGSFNGQTRAFMLKPNAYHWINPSGGAWHVTTNWDPQGDPGDGDTVIFALSGQYAVNAAPVFAAAAPTINFPVGRAIISGTNTVEFYNLSLNLLDDSVTEPALTVNDGGTVKITSGAGNLIHVIIGGEPPANPSNPPIAHLQVFNNGTSLNGTGRLSIGDEGAGDLFVANGGHLTSAEARLGGLLATAPGTAVVGGDGSLWDTGNIAVGFGVTGSLTIENGGRVNSNDGYVGFGGASADSRAAIDGIGLGNSQASMWALLGDLVIGQGAFGYVEAANGGDLYVTKNVRIVNGSLWIKNGNANGDPSDLDVLGSVFIGGYGRYSSLVLRSGAEGDIEGDLIIGKDGVGALHVWGDAGASGQARLGVVDPQAGLCAIGREYNGSVTADVYSMLRCQDMELGRAGTNGTGSLFVRGGYVSVLNVLRVGSVGGGAGRIDMEYDQNNAAISTVGTYIAPNGVVSGTGRLSATSLGLHNDGTLGPGITVLTPLAAAAGHESIAQTQDVAGTLIVSGTLTMGPTGRIEIPVTGKNAGQYGSLAVNGAANLDGVLALKFSGGFAPKQGDTFTFLAATGGISGAFDSVAISGLPPGFEYKLTTAGGQLQLEALNDGAPLRRLYLPLVVR
jgi:probable HAF family extracellular repeat protein/T5SS/PEP-CTERM-associated repeat protein